MYRLLACDIDDTILSPDGSLPDANRNALQSLHERGITIVVSSGRATVSVRRVAETILPLADDEYLISFNGARVTSALSGNVLFEQLLSRDAIEIVSRYARENNLVLQGYGESDFISETNDPRCAAYARATSMDFRLVADLGAALPAGCAKLLLIDEPEVLKRHYPNLMAESGGLFAGVFSKPTYLEIVHPEVNKGTALRFLATRLGIPIEETVAVGDSLNDSEMLEAAGLGVAVANAREALKRTADVVLETSAENGAIGELAERFFS